MTLVNVLPKCRFFTRLAPIALFTDGRANEPSLLSSCHLCNICIMLHILSRGVIRLKLVHRQTSVEAARSIWCVFSTSRLLGTLISFHPLLAAVILASCVGESTHNGVDFGNRLHD